MKYHANDPPAFVSNNGKLRYQAYSLHNFRKLPQIQRLSETQRFEIEVVGHVFPFKTNSYVVEELIDWDNVPDDPMFVLTFPQRGMLREAHFREMAATLKQGKDKAFIEQVANRIRTQLNPHPAGQVEHNLPELNGQKLRGIQHKYRETILFFPQQGQTCHAYCSFCFRWPQFVGINEWKIAMKEKELLVAYLEQHPEVTDVIFTGGDPMIMKSRILGDYIDALQEADLPHLRNIRIGSKSLSYWPYKFIDEPDSDGVLAVFERAVKAGKHIAFMGHFSHPREMDTPAVAQAIRRIRDTGAEIRTQSPLLRNINDTPALWAEMWQKQVQQGCIPYYLFVVRDTGAQHYFGVPLVDAWRLFQKAYRQVSGIARTVRGPSMSCLPGKVQVQGVARVHGEKVLVLNMLQGKNPQWVNRPFFARYDDKAIWLNELKPAFGEEKFFFEDELKQMHRKSGSLWTARGDAYRDHRNFPVNI